MVLEYIVKKFDSLESIAKKFNVSVCEIVTKNNLTSNELPSSLIIPVENKQQFSVVANFKRDFLFFGDGEKVKQSLQNVGLYCANLNNYACLFKQCSSSIYVVGVLDTINSICERFNIKKEELIKLNNLKTEKLFIGQIVKLS